MFNPFLPSADDILPSSHHNEVTARTAAPGPIHLRHLPHLPPHKPGVQE